MDGVGSRIKSMDDFYQIRGENGRDREGKEGTL